MPNGPGVHSPASRPRKALLDAFPSASTGVLGQVRIASVTHPAADLNLAGSPGFSLWRAKPHVCGLPGLAGGARQSSQDRLMPAELPLAFSSEHAALTGAHHEQLPTHQLTLDRALTNPAVRRDALLRALRAHYRQGKRPPACSWARHLTTTLQTAAEASDGVTARPGAWMSWGVKITKLPARTSRKSPWAS
jgi:hypothetical protein